MCGLVGKLNFDFQKPIEPILIKKMAQTLKHRGPDDEGIYVKDNIGLGLRRLAIIDLSKAGHQPMANEDKTVWIVYNGEIYNFKDLRKDLIRKGHRFSSRSDTETIIHLYEEYGKDCLRYLRGMFAFAIWDEKKKKLFMARDRIGKKPLYYFLNNHCLIFGSEIKAILEEPQVKRKVNHKAIHYYLTYHYIPSPQTAFQNVFKLPPAHFLIWENGKVNIQRYWALNYTPKINLSERECHQEILSRLEEAVKIRMISDVPLGAFLSGGTDSSSVVALMSRLSKTPIKTFSIGFKEGFYNELPYARVVAKIYKTDHHEFLVKPKALEVLPKLVWHYGEPFADSSALPVFYVAKMAKDYVTVALNGDGGDENFGGYRRYYFDQLWQHYHKLPSFFRNKIINSIPYTNSSRINLFLQKLKVLSQTSSDFQPQRHLWLLYWFNYDLKEKLYSEDFKESIRKENPLNIMIESYKKFGNFTDSIDNMISVEVNTYLPDDLLVKMDVACMANSLEARSPLLDHKFMEFTATLPVNFKIKKGERKYIFKKALENLLPKEIIYRQKKGFTPPVDDWFRKEMKDYASEILLDSETINRNYFRKEGIVKLLKEHCHSKINHGEVIWALIFLELWHRTFIDEK
ncbi:MAG: asparagine synthase (glutamine-hydrolyzing) [Candidatus Aminicenantia bacterium]